MCLTISINYLAVLLCGILSMVIGALWYGPLFGKTWMKEVGKTEEELRKDFNPAKTYGLAFIGHLVAAYVLALFLSNLNAITIGDGLKIAFIAWLGFTGAAIFINYLFNNKSFKLLLIDTFYFLIVFLLFSIILTIW